MSKIPATVFNTFKVTGHKEPAKVTKPKRAARLYTKSIFLEESQHRALKLISLQRGVKLNDLLHQVIEAYLTMSSMTDEEKQELLNPHYHL